MSFTEGYNFLLGNGLKKKSVEESGLIEDKFSADTSVDEEPNIFERAGILDALDDMYNIITGSYQRTQTMDPLNRIKDGTASDVR